MIITRRSYPLVVGGLVAKLCPTLVAPWAVVHQAPLSMGFPRQEHWSGLCLPVTSFLGLSSLHYFSYFPFSHLNSNSLSSPSFCSLIIATCVVFLCLPGPPRLENQMTFWMTLRFQDSNCLSGICSQRSPGFLLAHTICSFEFSAAAIVEVLGSCPWSPGLWQMGCREPTFLVALLLHLNHTHGHLFWVGEVRRVAVTYRCFLCLKEKRGKRISLCMGVQHGVCVCVWVCVYRCVPTFVSGFSLFFKPQTTKLLCFNFNKTH